MAAPMIIAVAGLAGSGKDTVAQMVQAALAPAPVDIVRFADPLKDAILAMFNRPGYRVSYDQVFGPSALRNAPIGDLRRPDGSPLTVRYALQTMGTELGRDLWHPDVWAAIGMGTARALAAAGRHVVITDARFLNEFKVVRKHGGELWHIVRPGAGLPADHPRWPWVKRLPLALQLDALFTHHPSEADLYHRALLQLRTEYIYNAATLESLEQQVHKLLS